MKIKKRQGGFENQKETRQALSLQYRQRLRCLFIKIACVVCLSKSPALSVYQNRLRCLFIKIACVVCLSKSPALSVYQNRLRCLFIKIACVVCLSKSHTPKTHKEHHAAPFEQKGMPATIFQNLQELHTAIGEKKQKQFEIKTARAAIVQDNLTIFNTLYLRLTEIYNIGKVLYKTTNPAKYDEYTFTKLIKKVRNTRSPKSEVSSL